MEMPRAYSSTAKIINIIIYANSTTQKNVPKQIRWPKSLYNFISKTIEAERLYYLWAIINNTARFY